MDQSVIQHGTRIGEGLGATRVVFRRLKLLATSGTKEELVGRPAGTADFFAPISSALHCVQQESSACVQAKDEENCLLEIVLGCIVLGQCSPGGL